MTLAILFGMMATAGILGVLLLARGLSVTAPRRILRTLGAREAGAFEGSAFASALGQGDAAPVLLVVPHDQANLFVLTDLTGRPNVAVTTGALEMFGDDEAKAAAGLVLARIRHADVAGATAAASVGIATATLAGLGAIEAHEAERAAWRWPPSWLLLPLGAALASALERRRPCVELDLLGAGISGLPGVTARLLERMEFTAHARPMAVPAGLARLALVDPLGGDRGWASVAAALAPVPMAAAGRARRLRGGERDPDGPRWARAA